MYAFECIKYFNKIDERFGNSLWRWSYDYPVKGKQDISNIDDPEFVALRRRRNKRKNNEAKLKKKERQHEQ